MMWKDLRVGDVLCPASGKDNAWRSFHLVLNDVELVEFIYLREVRLRLFDLEENGRERIVYMPAAGLLHPEYFCLRRDVK